MADDFEDLMDDEDFNGENSDSFINEILPPRQSVNIEGFADIEQSLLQAYNANHLPHAIILAGREGIGKATFAYRLARFLLTQENEMADEGPSLFGPAVEPTLPTNFDIQSNHPVIAQITSGGHADLLVIERQFDEKKGRLQDNIAVDDVRRITPFLRLTSGRGGWRVVIVDEADAIPRYAQNALLKILEEPPNHTLLILIAHSAGALLPTIRSRCRVIACRPLEQKTFGQLLRDSNSTLTRTDIDLLYNITGGSLGQALRLGGENGLSALHNLLAALEQWPDWHWPELYLLADQLSRADQAEAFRAFSELLRWLCDSVVQVKARHENLPGLLASTALSRLLAEMPLAALIAMRDKMVEHFATASQANLDKRQTVLGAFMIFGNRKAIAA